MYRFCDQEEGFKNKRCFRDYDSQLASSSLGTSVPRAASGRWDYGARVLPQTPVLILVSDVRELPSP